MSNMKVGILVASCFPRVTGVYARCGAVLQTLQQPPVFIEPKPGVLIANPEANGRACS